MEGRGLGVGVGAQEVRLSTTAENAKLAKIDRLVL